METKIYVVEREVNLGTWELLSHEYFTDELKATNVALHYMEVTNKTSGARVHELILSK